jgi:diacylglycerol kinase family enzyme
MLGVGFDAQVVHRLSLPLKRVLGRNAYVLQSLREVERYKFPPLRLRLDGTETEAASAVITKGRLYGGKFLLAPDARPAEPGFSVVLFGCGGPAAALMYGAALPVGLLGKAPGVRHVRARRIEVIGNVPLPAQTDGDAAGFTPLHVVDAAAPIEVVTG